MSAAGADRDQLATRLGWLDSGEVFFAAQLAALSDAQLLEASQLPGWTRRHVLSHIANNARALMNLLHWARTGTETPMYASPEHRNADIESRAELPAASLRADALASAKDLSGVMGAMPEAAWDGPIRTALGRAVTGAEIPWMRVREVWVHGVDLGAGASFADVDGDVAAALLADAARGFAGRADCPSVRLVPDAGEVMVIGSQTSSPEAVRGTVSALVAWVLGRSAGADLVSPGPLPALPRWL